MRTDQPISNPVVVLRDECDDWAVLFNPDTADAVGMKPTGVAVWKSMGGQRDLDAILGEVRDQFSDVAEAANGRVSAFVDDLAARGSGL